MRELISVIVPVYNVKAFLPRMLASLAAQTWPSIEFILVDDGSTDGSGAMCDAMAARDARFRVLHQANGGVSSARNSGIAAARGSLIGFADGDDWLEPTMYERLALALLDANADCAMCGYFEHFPGEWHTPAPHGTDSPATADREQAIYEVLRRFGPFCSVWNKLFRRDVLTENGIIQPFDPALCVGEDETWLVRVLLRTNRTAFVPEALYHWGSRADSATRNERITPGRWTVFAAKRITIQLVENLSPRLGLLARSRLVNDCYDMQVLAYRLHDKAALARVRQELHPYWGSYLRCNDAPPLRKAKVLVMQIMIACHLPARWVDWVYDLKRRQRAV